MGYPENLHAALEQLQEHLLQSWQLSLEELRTEAESLRKELAQVYEEKVLLNDQYEKLRHEMESIRLEQVQSQIELGELRALKDRHQATEAELQTLKDQDLERLTKIQQLETELKEVREYLQKEADQNARLTLELVDLKVAMDSERRHRHDTYEGFPSLNLPDLLPEEKEADESQILQKLAYEDSVTGLPNFHLGQRYLEVELAKKDKYTLALAILQVERWDDLEKLLGTPLSHELLGLFCERVRQCLRQEDVLVRGPGEEFWVIFPLPQGGPLGLKTLQDMVNRTLVKLFDALKTPFHLEEHKLVLQVNGGASLSQGQEEAPVVLERARMALAEVGKKGGNRLMVFQPEMEKRRKRLHQQVPLLRQALVRGQFDLRFQPIVELKTGMIKGVESLVRWNHPSEGILEPPAFLQAACESGLIIGIGDWVMGQVCQISKNHRQIYWSINISVQELMQADFVRRLTKAIEAAQLSRPDFIVIEVKEEELAGNHPRLLTTLKELRGWKIQLAIDDFSFDAVSMKWLESRGVSYIKLSPEVTQNLDQMLMRNLVRGAVMAADGMGAKVVAKGLENQGQLDLALENGCHWGQGHRLCSPLTFHEIEERLRTRKS